MQDGLPRYGASVADFGARGDGTADDAPAIQRALDEGVPLVVIPEGVYRIGQTLRIGSGTRLVAHPRALIRLADGAGTDAGVFLLTNKGHAAGDVEIEVRGGIWDGNNPGNRRGPDGPADSYTGVALNFVNTCRLRLRDLTVRDPESFFIRIGEVRDFVIERIRLEAPHLRPNQDGIHVGGFCEEGVIRDIEAVGPGCPNDDMVALNADDDVRRAINLGMRCGPIRDVRVESLSAADAYTFVRLLSQDSPLEDVEVRGVRGGCRYHAINMNRWRFPPGRGAIRRVRIADLDVRKHTSPNADALIDLALGAEEVTLVDCRRPADGRPEVATLAVHTGRKSRVVVEGLEHDQVAGLQTASTVAGLRVLRLAGAEPPERYRVEAGIPPEGCLSLPAGGFDRVTLNSGFA